jgi:hypothetical protein
MFDFNDEEINVAIKLLAAWKILELAGWHRLPAGTTFTTQ